VHLFDGLEVQELRSSMVQAVLTVFGLWFLVSLILPIFCTPFMPYMVQKSSGVQQFNTQSNNYKFPANSQPIN
jgi:hypothetical protein